MSAVKRFNREAQAAAKLVENLSQHFKLQRILESESCRPSPGRQSVRGGAADAAEYLTFFSTYFLIPASSILAKAFSSHRPFLSKTIRNVFAG